MTPTLAQFLKLSKTQKDKYKKDELYAIMESAQDNGNGNDFLTLVTSLTHLTEQIRILTESFTNHQATTIAQFAEFRQQMVKQNEIIAKQQVYLEKQDSKERECNVVILGVPEDNESLDSATSDRDKISKVWEAAGISSNVKSIRRIGTHDGSRRRPIIAEVDSKSERDTALVKGKDLKTHGNDIYHRIYIKKDQHPSVRQEWKRLHTVFQTEKERPGNEACDIQFIFKERKVYKDGQVIDQWNMQNF